MTDSPTPSEPRTTCDDHTEGPDGYVARHAWAQRMMQTHRQTRCDECGLWNVWVPRG